MSELLSICESEVSSKCEQDESEERNIESIRWNKLLSFLNRHYLIIGLLAFISFGILVPQPGVFMSRLPTHYSCIVLIFFISGLNLKTHEVVAAIKSYRASLWGLLSVLLVTPSIGTQLTALLPFSQKLINVSSVYQSDATIATSINTLNATIHAVKVSSSFRSIVGPEDFKIGLQIFLCCPSTLSSCVVMSTQAGGNYALALLVTVAANILGVFISPFMITWLTGLGSAIKLEVVGKIVLNLFLTILLPLLIGKIIARWKRIKSITNTHANGIRFINLTALMIIPWMKVSSAGMDGVFKLVTIENIIIIALWGGAVHICFLIINALVARFILRLDTRATKSIIILASQKAMSLAIILISYLPEYVGNQGLMIIAILTVYVTQIIIDVVVTFQLSKLKNESKEEKEDSGKQQTVELNLENVYTIDRFIIMESTV